MIDNNLETAAKTRDVAGKLMNSVMAILTLVFVILYVAAFSGKFDPLKNNAALLYLEPIIFILIGYYFGRLPSRQTERTLKDELARQAQKADAAQYAKEKVQQEREVLEEKIKNAKTALKAMTLPGMNDEPNFRTKAIKTAFNILDS